MKSDEQLMREYLEETGQKADFANITVLRILDNLPMSDEDNKETIQ